MTRDDRALVERLPDHELLALTAFLEARSEPVQGIVGVMYSVLNRVARQHCGRSITEVCLWPQQYSCWNDRDPNLPRGLDLAQELLEGGSIAVVPDGIVLSTCLFLADRVLRVPPSVPDPTQGSTHYFNPRSVARVPAWADPHTGAELTATIGAHRFYRHVA
jgi:N-acetylmuramoyl-L-alanine amidase